MRTLFLILLSSLLVTSCQNNQSVGPGDAKSLATSQQTDCGFTQNAYGQRVSWKSNIPVTIWVSQDYPSDFVEALESSAQLWSDAAGMTLFQLKYSTTDPANSPSKDKLNTLSWKNTWNDKQPGQQGVTKLYWENSQIVEADVSINNFNFNYFLVTPTTHFDIHLESLLVHELGHVLGLKHQTSVPSVMWTILNGATLRNTLTTADKSSIKCEY